MILNLLLFLHMIQPYLSGLLGNKFVLMIFDELTPSGLHLATEQLQSSLPPFDWD